MSICDYCNSVVVRHDMKLETLGTQSEIGEDMSPLQVGTGGMYQGKKFEIIGRQKTVYDDGYWNEWYILFEDDRVGWLAEAQGFYMVSFETEEKIDVPKQADLKVDDIIKINTLEFSVDDIKDVVYKGCEGELPQKNLVGTKATSVDLIGPGKRFGNIVYTTDHIYIYLGSYQEFENFSFTSLRKIEGW